MEQEVAVVVGVGPGLGWALAQRFVRAGMRTAIAARNTEKLAALLRQHGGDIPEDRLRCYACDVTQTVEVARLFEAVDNDFGAPNAVVFNAGAFEPAGILDITPEAFERCWRIGCFGGFLVGQAAVRRMLGRGGTLIFTGATASLRGGSRFANLAVPKFGLRALAQSMAREFGPQGVHVAHVVIDGQIESERYAQLGAQRGPDALLAPDAIAETYYQLHRQARSAWTLELDLRPWVEKF